MTAASGGKCASQYTESPVEVDVADEIKLDVYHHPYSFHHSV
jgi:hypothetical protein